MGWWKMSNGVVIGKAPLEYLEGRLREGAFWVSPDEFPRDAVRHLDALYVDGVGRGPTDAELMELLAHCR